MKKLIYTIAFVALGIASSNAQEQDKSKAEGKPKMEGRKHFERDSQLTSEQRAEKAAAAMQKKLSLTNEQKQKVQAIELDRIKKNEEWRKRDDKTMKYKMEERKAYMNATRAKIDQVLTEDQRKALASAREEAKEKMRGHKGKRNN